MLSLATASRTESSRTGFPRECTLYGCWCDRVIDGFWLRRKLRAHPHFRNLPHSPSELHSSSRQRLRESFSCDGFIRDVGDNRLRGTFKRGRRPYNEWANRNTGHPGKKPHGWLLPLKTLKSAPWEAYE